MNLLIIGASGYIGKRLLSVSKSFSNNVLSTTSDKNSSFFLDLANPDEFNYQLLKNIDVVFMAAAISSPDICLNEYDYAWNINVVGTSKFIKKAIYYGAKVIFFSSDTVYGEKNTEFNETADCNPAGKYAEMKHEIENRFINDPLFKSIRLSYVFSFEDKFTKYLLNCEKRNEEVEIFHPFFRAVIHRDDVIQGVISLAKYWEVFPQSIINFGGSQVLSRVDFVETIKQEALPNLRFRITEPNDEFFKNRPRIINMESSILPSLLGRETTNFKDSIKLEFKLK